MPLKTRQQVRNEFASRGWSYSDWAKQRGYSAALVCMIVNDDDRAPQRKCLRGESHNIAVELGLKQGQVSRQQAKPRMQLAAA
ncbi:MULTISPECIES: DNA-binding protein [Comamonadaceae]|uniref:DNA-binding protein n=1 Tax=unclassified Acidovorax TaxID=2684926 RepID=UPI00234B9EEC|nr:MULTISPECIES: DNA-binding protein [Comamonadaceae]WCM99956.1 DNA-binding protein [Acidovorax sp. GBBC 1281]WOI46993.1 DNA-binding protein [Paracidovorax avenae]GKT19742.1 DNA-binding protein [Acidovorax sp. SUPP2522]GKT21689.1 DNA-binding protein [Acidovorax sp. SUPP3334]